MGGLFLIVILLEACMIILEGLLLKGFKVRTFRVYNKDTNLRIITYTYNLICQICAGKHNLKGNCHFQTRRKEKNMAPKLGRTIHTPINVIKKLLQLIKLK